MDELYLRLVLAGDASKFSWFVDRYKGMAFSIAYRIVNSREDAEEIVQDAFLKAFKSLGKFRQGSKFSTWFYRIVVNTALTKTRSAMPRPDSFDEGVVEDLLVENVDSAYHNLDTAERKAVVNDAMDRLSVEDRLLLTLYYLNENSIGEITEITGIARENVKMKLYRARNRMYKVLNGKLKSEISSVLG